MSLGCIKGVITGNDTGLISTSPLWLPINLSAKLKVVLDTATSSIVYSLALIGLSSSTTTFVL